MGMGEPEDNESGEEEAIHAEIIVSKIKTAAVFNELLYQFY